MTVPRNFFSNSWSAVMNLLRLFLLHLNFFSFSYVLVGIADYMEANNDEVFQFFMFCFQFLWNFIVFSTNRLN